MPSWKLHVPDGVQDYLPQECFLKRQIENTLLSCFASWGYDEIQTPSFEYYDVFAAGIGQVQQEQMHKLADGQGRILVLRPDLTLPIARVAATKLTNQPLPLRLCYAGNGFGYSANEAGRRQEFAQAGIELLGADVITADAEVVALAIEALIHLGITEFQIEIGQVAFCRALLEEANLTPEQSTQLLELIEEKNMPALRAMLDNLPLSPTLRQSLLALPRLFGRSEILEQAANLTIPQPAINALENLRQLYTALECRGLSQWISFDLGMVQEMDYYSGIVFRGLADGLGYPLVSGGRYDGLVGNFGRDMAAIGFAIGLQGLLQICSRDLADWQQPTWLVGSDSCHTQEALHWMQQKRQQGERVLQFLGTDKAAMRIEARQRQIPHICYHGSNGEEVDF